MRSRIAAIPGRFTRMAYGVYVWMALIGCGLPTLLVLLATPSRRGRRRIASWGARVFFSVIGSPVRIAGTELLPATPSVVVANHASYLDGIILTAALPPRFTFLIKHEMASFPFAGTLLKRLGSEFVDRDNSSHRHRVARRLLKAAARGDSLAFFPEGTFDRTPGLRPFLAGAFGAAWRARLPLVPIVISGSRAKLPADCWLCSPGPLSIRICRPIDPGAHAAAPELLEAARRSMLEWLNEPDLARAGDGHRGERLAEASLQGGGG